MAASVRFCHPSQILTSVNDLETTTATQMHCVLIPKARTCVAALEVLAEMVKYVKVRHCPLFVILCFIYTKPNDYF